jgi:hypothetical protein
MLNFRVLKTLLSWLIPLSTVSVPIPAMAQNYWGMSCGDLWYQRNAIYARNGFCFKTERAISVFGNANCRFYNEGDVPMSSYERQQIQIIVSVERQKGC